MTSRLIQMQARFQQKQLQEREEKLLRLYETQQQRAFEKVGKNSAGSNTSTGSTGGGKVRQMFDERRQKAGIDKSYPLEPIGAKIGSKVRGASVDRVKTNNNINNINSNNKTRASLPKSLTQIKSEKPLIKKREVTKSISNQNGNIFDDTDSSANGNSHDLVDMLNRHSICDNLEDEQLPPLNFDDEDEEVLNRKVVNVEVKLPSQKNGYNNVNKEIIEKEAPIPVAKTKTTFAASRKPVNTSASLSSRPLSSSQNTKKPLSNSNSASQPHTVKMSKLGSNRAPAVNKPSAKQGGRSSMAVVVRDDLDECKYCGRRFLHDRIQVHENVCSKTNKKQRKVYDAFKHRVQGTEIEPFSGKPKGGKYAPKKTTVPAGGSINKKNNWRTTHEDFIATIRAAKMTQAYLAKGGKLSDLPPPPPTSHPDYVQCPHCGRRFNDSAAARHIPKCATYEYNKPKPVMRKR